MPLHYLLSEADMANIVMSEEGYGFNCEWIAAGSGFGEEICGVDKDCIVAPSSPDILPKIEPRDPEEIVDEYVEIQVTEEEVISDQWGSQHPGSEEDPIGFVDSNHEEDVIVSLPEEQQDEYSRLHPYPCDFCSRRFSKKSALTAHMFSHQKSRPHGCNMCGEQFLGKNDLVEHMKIHAYAPVKQEPEDDYEEFTQLPKAEVKVKSKPRRKKKNLKKYNEFEDSFVREKKIKTENPFDEDVKYSIDIPHEEIPKFPVIDPSRPYVCQHCGVGFAREKALTSHTMIHVGDSAFECDSCGEMFQSEEHLEQHNSLRHGHLPRKREDNDGSFLCNDCGLSFQWYNQLKKHRKVHHIKQEEVQQDENVQLCSLCNIVFDSIEDLLCHKHDHDSENIGVHSCYVCGEIFESILHLQDHIKTHRSNHMCHFCEKMFKDGKTLARHLVSHLENRTFPCTVCSRRFHSKAKLRKHMATHDENKSNTSTILCRECGQGFIDGPSLLTHRQNVHGVNIARKFPCLQCGKAFNSRSSHQIHLRIHTGERPYGCKYCWKAFGDGGTLRKHERIHTGEKPYVCPVCSKAFNQRVVLREHIRAHHSGTENRLSNNAYECMVCGALMNTSSELCAHLVLHSDENTAKHRTPKTSRKYVRKKKFSAPAFEEDSVASSGEEVRRKPPAPLPPPPPPPPQVPAPKPHFVRFADDLETVIKIEPDLMSSTSSDGKGRARIVRSGRKGVPKGQNKRYMRGKTKAARLMNNTSYASKYVVSRPDNSESFLNEINQVDEVSPPILNGSAPRSRPRTKNVSYHNMKSEPRYELATFPVENKRTPTSRKRVQIKQESPDAIDNQYVNGIDIFEETGGEQIETCIVDDIDVELKLEVKTSESEECFMGSDDIAIKTELVSCDMCSEVFTSRSDLLKHIQIHI